MFGYSSYWKVKALSLPLESVVPAPTCLTTQCSRESWHSALLRLVQRKLCIFHFDPFEDTSLEKAEAMEQTLKSTEALLAMLTQGPSLEAQHRKQLWPELSPTQAVWDIFSHVSHAVEILIILEPEKTHSCYALPNLYPVYFLPASTHQPDNLLWLLIDPTSTQDGCQMGIIMSIFLPTFIVRASIVKENFSFSF